MKLSVIKPIDAEYPQRLLERLGERAPKSLTTAGDIALLFQPKTALFCSARCASDKMLSACEAVRKLRDNGVTVISGFHSPVEKKSLQILLKGNQPIIICLARALEKIRVPSGWREPLESGRMLLLSRFDKSRRADKDTARRRNELVAALADEALIIYAEQGGGIEKISAMIDQWLIPKIDLAKGL
ncbi:MAG TPA: DNA-processing protein DprA [Candidatus Binatia bacterium]|nr:DNA-processing protein DprA [Candidatus Binatia bacterium]